MSDVHTAAVPSTRAPATRRTPLFDYWWVPFWAFTPFVFALYAKAWLLPGEDSKFWLTVFWMPNFVFVAGLVGTLLHVVVVRGERLRLLKYTTVCAALGTGLAWGMWRLDRSWYLPLLVDVRFARADIPADATSHEFIQGGVLFGTGAWLHAHEYIHDGLAVVRLRHREYLLRPNLDWDADEWNPGCPKFSCPASDGWFYFFKWDT